MKKLLLALIVVAVLFAGCAGSSSGKAKIGVTIYKFDDTFMSAVRRAIESNAATKAELSIVDSQNQQPTQNDQVDTFLTQKVKALAINPVDRTAAGIIIGKAKAKNVPVVFFNREPLPEDMKAWDKVYYVGAKAEQSGTMQGQLLADWWKANPAADKNKDGKMQYIMLTGEPGHQDALLRTEFSMKAIEAAGIKVQKLAEDTAMWDRVKGQEKMAAFIAKFGNKIEAVLCNNDDMALGAIEAFKAAGYFKDPKKFMPIVGVDATAPALDALEQGTLLGTVLNDADNQGKATFDLAFALATKADMTKTGWEIADGKYVWVPYQMVTKENFKNFKK
jgi:methyl-galactoside transport system substrate-binding protein